MAATSGDLMHANAYILTDEETLVPAAPPADEVTVTATNLEECELNSNSVFSKEHGKKLLSNHNLSENKCSWPVVNVSLEYKNLATDSSKSDIKLFTSQNGETDFTCVNDEIQSNICGENEMIEMDNLFPVEENVSSDMVIFC